ncbi:MAG: ABC transporter substrate-binding protein [Hyphomicrobiales bacterium]|nr:MAG: ABC transporter substrate-binding protein [Hyphomicrobiales bacterium]
MKRRTFLKGSALAAAGSTLVAAPAIAQSMPELKWRLTSSFPKSLDTIYGTAQTFAKYVAEATDNKFQIQTFGAGEIVPGLQALDAVTAASVEIAQTPLYFYIGREPALAYATGVAFGMNHRHQQSWWSFGGGQELCNEALKPMKAYAILAGNSGTQMGGWFRKEIKSVDDLKGLKFRIAGMGGHILSKLGVVPQQLAGGDVYPALEKGAIDAAEFVGPYDDEKLGFYKVAKYYYFPGWWEGGAMLHMVVNDEKWASLPKVYQAILHQAGTAAGAWMLEKYDSVNPLALKRLIANGTELRAFPQPVMEACYKTAQEYHAEIAAKSPLFKRTKDSHDAYMKEVMAYTQIAENYYDNYLLSVMRRG